MPGKRESFKILTRCFLKKLQARYSRWPSAPPSGAWGTRPGWATPGFGSHASFLEAKYITCQHNGRDPKTHTVSYALVVTSLRLVYRRCQSFFSSRISTTYRTNKSLVIHRTGITIIVEESLVSKMMKQKWTSPSLDLRLRMRVRILFSVNILPNLVFIFLHFDSIKTTQSGEAYVSKAGFLTGHHQHCECCLVPWRMSHSIPSLYATDVSRTFPETGQPKVSPDTIECSLGGQRHSW